MLLRRKHADSTSCCSSGNRIRTPVAAIPLHDPQEGIEELEKAALIPGYVNRPIKALADKYPRDEHPEVAQNGFWVDTYGLDSEHAYDPFWAKAVELKVVLTAHSAGMGWTARRSPSNYMYNHIGHFADASHALAKALFFGGVTRRFPDLRVGLLEGGAAWAANLFADLVGHWKKRNGRAIENYNPANVDKELLTRLFERYGSGVLRGKPPVDGDALIGGALGRANNFRAQDPSRLDDFAAAGIEKVEDIAARFVPNFYCGVPKNLIEVSRVLMFSPYRLIRSVVLPSASPAILNGLELGFLYAWLATIGAEYLMNATGGLGSMMESAQESLEMDVVFVGVILSGLVGAGISLSLRLARGRLLRWRTSFV